MGCITVYSPFPDCPLVYRRHQRLQGQTGAGTVHRKIFSDDQDLRLDKIENCAIILSMMKSIPRKISLVTLSAMITVMVLLYVCPMEMDGGKGMVMAAGHSSCENTSSVGSSSLSRLNTTSDCISIRLALVGQTLKNLTSTLGSFYLLAVLSAFVLYLFVRKLLMNWSRSSFVRLRFYFRHYCTLIKFLTETKLRQYLILLGNYTVASA